ncbi:hypothetical protein CDL15_Pgr009149 [Punica granatum]|nr:hypothetical protein CDL15_Pgr009149 [Punica granatum]
MPARQTPVRAHASAPNARMHACRALDAPARTPARSSAQPVCWRTPARSPDVHAHPNVHPLHPSILPSVLLSHPTLEHFPDSFLASRD